MLYGIIDLKAFALSKNLQLKREIETQGKNFLINELLKKPSKIIYDPNGKPFLKDDTMHISITHSHDKLAIILNELEKTGIDIELIRDKVIKIKHKFLAEDELLDAGIHVEKLLVYWAAKETLFKIVSEQGINFIGDLFIKPFQYNLEGGNITGEINLPLLKRSYHLHYQQTEDYILVYPV